MSKAWKDHERAVARALGGSRHVRRHRGEPGPDVDLPEGSNLSIECKYRAGLPRLLVLGLAQAKANAREGQVPLLVVKQRRQNGAIACMALEDLPRLLSPPTKEFSDDALLDDPATWKAVEDGHAPDEQASQ